VQFLHFGTAAGIGITIENVNHAVTVDVFIVVSDAVLIEIPAINAVGAVSAVDAILTVVSGTAEHQKHTEQDSDQFEAIAPAPGAYTHHTQSPKVIGCRSGLT
jgi:hypothetical protein